MRVNLVSLPHLDLSEITPLKNKMMQNPNNYNNQQTLLNKLTKSSQKIKNKILTIPPSTNSNLNSLIFIPSPYYKDSFISLNKKYKLYKKNKELIIRGNREIVVNVVGEEYCYDEGEKFVVLYLDSDFTREEMIQSLEGSNSVKTRDTINLENFEISLKNKNLVLEKLKFFKTTVLLVLDDLIFDYFDNFKRFYKTEILPLKDINSEIELQNFCLSFLSETIFPCLTRIYSQKNSFYSFVFNNYKHDFQQDLDLTEIIEIFKSIFDTTDTSENEKFKTPIEMCILLSKAIDSLTTSFSSTTSEMGADDLFPLFIHCLVSSNPEHIYSCFVYMKEFNFSLEFMTGLEYCLTTFEACLFYIDDTYGNKFSVDDISMSGIKANTNGVTCDGVNRVDAVTTASKIVTSNQNDDFLDTLRELEDGTSSGLVQDRHYY